MERMRTVIIKAFLPSNWQRHILPVLGGGAIVFSLYVSSRYDLLLFHNFVEFISALVIFLIFVIAWYTRHVMDNRYLLILGMAALPVGVIVLLHTVAYERMQVFPGFSTDISMQLWVISRYLWSGSFFLAPFFIGGRKLHAEAALAILCGVSLLLLGAVYAGWFPRCYSEYTGMTAFKTVSEFLVSVLLLASLALLYLKQRAFDRRVYIYLSFSILATLLATLSYTRHVAVVDMTNVGGHFFELLACYLIFKAVVVTGMVKPTDLLFRDLKLSEEKARENEERYRSLIELSPDAIAVHCEGRFIYINPAGASLYGTHDVNQIIGRKVLELVPPEYRGIIADRIRNSYEKKLKAPLQELKILRLDGGIIDVEAASTPVSYDGKPATQVVVRDVTVRKRAQEALRCANEELELRVQERTRDLKATVDALQEEIRHRTKAEEETARLASAVGSAAEAVVITDPSTGAIVYSNPAFEQMTGYAKNEIIGRTLHFLESGRHTEEYYAGLRDALAKNGVWNGRLINQRKDGSIYYADCTVSPVRNAGGDIINYVYVQRDVTEKLRLESIAEAAVTMNNIGYVFSGISHEIGNPVSALMVTLDMLKSSVAVMSREDIAEYAERSLQQVAKIEYLLGSLRNYGMYQTPELQRTRMSEFLEQFLSLVSKDFRRKGISVNADVMPGAEAAYADPRALQQIMLNLFTNAADALQGRKDGRIDVHIAPERQGRVRISVRDNGSGMTEGQQTNLFKPFYTSKPHGTGLGMVIVKNMLTGMQGTIEVESRADEGTTVIMTIPGGDHE